MAAQASTTKERKYIPNAMRAIINGRIATIYKGRRIIATYKSGEPLKGKLEY